MDDQKKTYMKDKKIKRGNSSEFRLSFSFPDELKEPLTILAMKENRKVQGYVKKILMNVIREIKEYNKEKEERNV